MTTLSYRRNGEKGTTMESTVKACAETMISAFEFFLMERENEDLAEPIREAILESVSPVIKLKQQRTTVVINRDEYGLNQLVRFIIHTISESDTAVIINGVDIFDWE